MCDYQIVTGALSQEEVAAAASALDAAERSRVQIPLLSGDYAAMTMDDAYAIQTEWVRRKRNSGDGVVGWKIGLTSKAMQAALSIDIPDSGVLLQSMVFANGATVPPDRFIQPRIEAVSLPGFCLPPKALIASKFSEPVAP